MNEHETHEVRWQNTFRREDGQGGFRSAPKMVVGRAESLALLIGWEVSTANLIDARDVLLAHAEEGNGARIRYRMLASSIGIELLQRAQLEPSIVGPDFGVNLFGELIANGDIADEEDRADDALRSRLNAVTLALQTSAYEAATPEYRRELADEALEALKIALSMALDSLVDLKLRREEILTKNLLGTIAEAVIIGAFAKSTLNEHGIITVAATMRQDKGVGEKDAFGMDQNPNHDVVQLQFQSPDKSGTVRAPRTRAKIQVKYNERTSSEINYAHDVTVIYFKQALFNAQLKIGQTESIETGIATLTRTQGAKCESLWKAVYAEIEKQIIQRRLSQVS